MTLSASPMGSPTNARVTGEKRIYRRPAPYVITIASPMKRPSQSLSILYNACPPGQQTR